LIDGFAVVLARCDVEIERVFLGIAAIRHRGSNQVSYRIDLIPGAEHALVSGRVVPNTSSASRTFFWLARSQLGTSKRPGPPGCSTLIASCRVWTFFMSSGSF